MGKLLYRPDIAGSIRTLGVGESLSIPQKEATVEGVRSTACRIGTGTYSVNKVKDAIIVTRTQ